MNDRLEMLRKISNRLAICLGILVGLFVPGAYLLHLTDSPFISAPLAAFFVGMIGGFVGLQRRLKAMSNDDLTLLSNSWVYVCLSPLVGGILAVVVYVLFISELLAGDLFPGFDPDGSVVDMKPDTPVVDTPVVDKPVVDTLAVESKPDTAVVAASKDSTERGMKVIFEIHGDATDYGKMLFWCFLAGFSERFATDIFSRFESDSGVSSTKE